MEKIRFLMSGVWEFLRPFAYQLMTQGGRILAQAAMTAVTAVAVSMQDQDGAAKRKAAFEMIQADLAKQGVSLAASLINAAIEAAVLKMKDM